MDGCGSADVVYGFQVGVNMIYAPKSFFDPIKRAISERHWESILFESAQMSAKYEQGGRKSLLDDSCNV